MNALVLLALPWWIGIGGRNAFGVETPLNPDFGVYAIAGLFAAGDHVQPFVRMGWARGPGNNETLDTFRTGAGLAAGAPFANGLVWLGGATALEGVVVLGHEPFTSRVVGMISVSALAQLRPWRRFLVGVEAGPDFFPSPLSDLHGEREWGAVRLNAGLRLGVIFDSESCGCFR
jgi:hypothetical protein